MLHKWHGTIALINQALAEDEVANDTTTRILDPNLICSCLLYTSPSPRD